MKKVCKEILKILLITIVLSVLMLTAIWIGDIVHHEYLTSKYGYQFKEIYKENTMMGHDLYKLKVIAYYDDYAKIYCVTGNEETGTKAGDILRFKKEEGKWVYDSWIDTVWSNRGSADGYMWPYGR